MEEKINWQYFFGGGKIPHQDHYYKSEICGVRVEKHTYRSRIEFSIGNMDLAKEKYKSESELISAVMDLKDTTSND